MLTLNNILVPIDFSHRSGAAARRGVLLASRFGAELTFVHVIDRFPYAGTDLEIFYAENGEVISGKGLDEMFCRKLHEFAEGVAGSGRAEEVLLKGDPAREITRFAEEEGIDLILIPTRGYGPFRKFLLGSVTAKVLHDANCAVLTGSHKEGEPPETPPPFHRIGCALDLEEQSEALLGWASELSKVLGAELFLIHATPLLQLTVNDLNMVVAEWRQMAESTAERKMRELARKVHCEAEICVANGDPVDFVISTAKEKKLDALVIGRGMAKRRASRLPTHAYGIIRESPCPVFSLP